MYQNYVRISRERLATVSKQLAQMLLICFLGCVNVHVFGTNVRNIHILMSEVTQSISGDSALHGGCRWFIRGDL